MLSVFSFGLGLIALAFVATCVYLLKRDLIAVISARKPKLSTQSRLLAIGGIFAGLALFAASVFIELAAK